MKFSCSTEINVPLVKVVDLFTTTSHLIHWQTGFVSHEMLESFKAFAENQQ